MEVGILLSKDEDEDRAEGVTHWVVSVDGSSEEEIISEKMLGRVLEDLDQSDSSTYEKSQQDKIPAKKGSSAKAFKGKKGFAGNNKRRSGDALGDEDGILDIERGPAPKPKRKSGDETVVEVQMLTGTLFIYRGENHRVEFTRTV